MAAIWPADVSQWANLDGFDEGGDSDIEEFQPEIGPPKERPKYSTGSDTIGFVTTMSFVAYDALIVFYRDVIADGTLAFMRRHPRNPTGPFIEFKFMDEPALTARGPDWGDVAMTIRKAA